MTACSSSGKKAATPTTAAAGGAGSSSSSSSSAAPAAGAPIKVGMMCTCSGAGGFGASILPGKQVYQAWVNTVNASGGINGHSVQLIALDDAGNPGTASSNLQTLLSDHVVAIADLSVADVAWASTAASANIPVVGIETANGPFGTNPDFYPEGQTNDSAIQAVFSTAKAAAAPSLANVYCAESPVCAQSVAPFKTAGTAAGIPVVYNAEVSATAPNYTAQCLAAQQAHAGSVFIGDSSVVITRIASDCTKQGYNPVWLTEGLGYGLNEASTPGLKDKLWTEFPSTPFWSTSAVVQAANAAIDKYFPGVRENKNLYNQSNFMSWASGQMLEDALKNAGLTPSATPTAAMVTQGLNAFKGDNLDGLTVPLTFTAGKPHTVDCWIITRTQNGTPSLVNNGQVTCANGAST
jgi:branched-chain amino acid transport system substrate-binding protein